MNSNKRSASSNSVRQNGNKKRKLNDGSAMNVDRVFAPVAQGLIRRQPEPQLTFLNSRSGDTLVRHSEYLADVAGSVAFAATQLEINPGRSEMFPWLNAIARRFESYRFRKLHFRFESQAPTSATGTVILAVDYDAADAAPVDKVSAMSYRGSTRCAPWESMVHASQASDLHKLASNYVRGDLTLAANLDVKTYDIGNLFICTQGQAGTTAVGELYVDYEVELLTPQLSPSDVPASKVTGSAGLTTAVMFGTNAAITAGSNIDLSVNAAGDTVTFNQAFEGLAFVFGTATAMDMTTATGTATSSLIADCATGAGGSRAGGAYTIRAIAGQTFIPACTTWTTPTAVVWRFSAWPNSLA